VNPTTKTSWLVADAYAERLAGDMSWLGDLITGLKAASGDETDWARIRFKRA